MVREALDFDIGGALSSIDSLSRALTSAATGFGSELNRAVDVLRNVAVTADASEITPAVEGALDAADGTKQVEADATEVTGAVEGAVDSADGTKAVDADTTAVPPAIDGAIDSASTSVTIDADASNVTAQIDGAIHASDTTVGINVDVQGVDAAAQGLENVSESVDGAGVAVQGVGAGIGNLLTPTRIATVGVALLGAAVVKTGIDYNVLEQRSRAALTTILGSAEAASQMMEELNEFASTSPFPRQAFIQATQQLLAFGFEAREVVPILGTIQDAVAAIGGGEAEIQTLVDVFASIQVQGKITGDEVQRLGLVGVNVFEILGEAAGKSASEIREDISAGTIDAETAITALTTGMEERFRRARRRG